MFSFERKTINSLQLALALSAVGYLGIVAGLIWPIAGYLGFAALTSGLVMLLVKRSVLDRMRDFCSELRGFFA